MATIKDVAKLAGVSSSTVSKYLNNPEAMKAENYLLVENAVKKLNYTPNLLARSLRVNSSRTIAVIAQEITNPFHATLYNIIRKEAQKSGYSVVLYSASDIDGNLDDIFGPVPISYFSGVIIAYLTDILQSYDFAISNINVPSVVLSNDLGVSKAYPSVTSVYLDIKAGIIQAVEHLISLGMRKIAFLGSTTNPPELEPKLSAFLDTLEKHNLKPCHIINSKQDYTAASGYHSVENLLRMKSLPDAIVVASDIMTLGAMRCLADYGLSIPEDMLLVSCDDTILSSMASPAWTSVCLPVEDASSKACELLIGQIKKQPVEGQVVSFNTNLIVRETTKLVQRITDN